MRCEKCGSEMSYNMDKEEWFCEECSKKGYHRMTNACENCCKTGKSMAEYIKKLEEQNKIYRKALRDIQLAILEKAEDTVWFSKSETVVDYIANLLGEK